MLQGRRGTRKSVDAPSSTYTPNCAKFSDFFVRSSMTFTLQPRPSKRLTPCSQPRIPCPAGQHPASPRENLGVRCGRGKTAKPGSGFDKGRSTSPTNWRRAGASRVPAVSDLQCAWPMLVFCVAPKSMYLLRTVPPNATNINPAGMVYGMHARPAWQNHPCNRPPSCALNIPNSEPILAIGPVPCAGLFYG